MLADYAFTARDAQGQSRQGTLNVGSAREAARELASRGWVALEIRLQQADRPRSPPAAGATDPAPAAARPEPGTTAPPGIMSWRPGAAKRRHQALSLVLRELASLLKAGVPLMQSLRLGAESTAMPDVRGMLQRLQADLDHGHTLVAAAEREHRLTGLLKAYDVAMLQVAESTGRLPETFIDLHNHREFSRATQEQVSAALRYPLFVIATCVIAAAIVNIWVIPSFAKVFAASRTELPGLTVLLMTVSNAVVKGWPVALPALAGSLWGWRRWLASTRGHLWWDQHKLRLPIVGPILHGIVLARMSASLGSLLRAGLTLSDALLTSSRTVGNAWYETRMVRMCGDLARGGSIGASARAMGILPPAMQQLFTIGEQSGSLEELMREMSNHYRQEVDYAVKQLSASLEPVLIWFLGISVLVLALGVFMPMWDLGRVSTG